MIDDVVEGFEDPIREPIFAHELPDVFLGIQLGHLAGNAMSVMLEGTFNPPERCHPA